MKFQLDGENVRNVKDLLRQKRECLHKSCTSKRLIETFQRYPFRLN